MESVSSPESHVIVVVGALLDTGGDKDESVRDAIALSLHRLANNYPNEVIRSICLFRQRHLKMTGPYLSTLLASLERICQEMTCHLDNTIVQQLIEFSIEEMTRSTLILPDSQLPASNILVSLGEHHCNKVVEGLLPCCQPGLIPHYTILLTMGNLAMTNVTAFVPFIKSTLGVIIPLLPTARTESLRQAFSFALGRFAEAVLEYLANMERTHDPNVTKECFSDEISAAYDVLANSWIFSRETKVLEAVVAALGPLYSVLPRDKGSEHTSRLLHCLLGLYRRSNTPPAHIITQCLAMVLSAAPALVLEMQFDQLTHTLGNMVVATLDYTIPNTVKNHSEVLRCYDMLGVHTPSRLSELLLKQMRYGSEKERIEALIVSAHLLSSVDSVLHSRIADFTAALRALLTDNSIRIKKFLLKAIVALAYRGNIEDGYDFIEFLVRHACTNPHNSGAEWDELREMCGNTVYLLTTTVPPVEALMWVVLSRLLLVLEYDSSYAIIARSLAHLAAKMAPSACAAKGSGVPSSEALLARCLSLLGSPLDCNRGPHLLTFLQHFAPHLCPQLPPLWAHKVPHLVSYLEVSEWDESEWEALLLEFISSTLQTVGDENWAISLCSQMSAELALFPQTAVDERAIATKGLALTASTITDRQVVNSYMDVLLTPLKTHSLVDSKACARGIGLLSRTHLAVVLSRLEAAAETELNRRSTRLLGLIKDTKTDAEVERSRVTLLRCYASIAQQASPSLFLPCLELGLMQWLMKQIVLAKEPVCREAAFETVLNIAETLERQKDSMRESLTCRGQLISVTLAQMQACDTSDHLLLKVIISLVRLPPGLSPEQRTNILCTCFDTVFTGEGTSEDVTRSQLALRNLALLVEELLQNAATPATLDEIVTLLQPWLIQRNPRQRIAAINILRTVLLAYAQHIQLTYQSPSRLGEAGGLLGRAVVRCFDPEPLVRSAALQCAHLVLTVSALYEGHTGSDTQLDSSFAELKARDVEHIAGDLATVVSGKLPHMQLSHFAESLIEGMDDVEPSTAAGVGVVLVAFLRTKGGELYHHVNDILAMLLLRLVNLHAGGRSGAVKSVLALAQHHPKVVFSMLLSQTLPLHQSICECWKAIATDAALSAEATDQFLRLIGAASPYDDQADGHYKERPRIAALQPLAVTSAFGEMLQMPVMRDLVVSRFAELFSLFFTLLAAYVGASPPVNTPSNNKFAFIPNREAYKIIPARVVQDTFNAFLLCSGCGVASDALLQCTRLELGDSLDHFLEMTSCLSKSICESVPHLLPKIMTTMSHYSDSGCEPMRIAVTAFQVECVALQCGGQAVLVDNVVSSLLASLMDPEPTVRRLGLCGLANIACLHHHQSERHLECVLPALMQGLDNDDACSHYEIALEAMKGFTRLLPVVSQSKVADIQVAIAVRIKPFFEKDDVALRTTSLRLFGVLASSGDVSQAAFREQIRGNLICLLLHLTELNFAVIKACKISLRASAPLLQADKVSTMLLDHLIDNATLHYQQFITDLAKLIVEELPELVPVFIMTLLTYTKSSWTEIRASSPLFIGVLYSFSPETVKECVSLDSVTCRLLQLLKDSDRDVRAKTAHALSVLFGPYHSLVNRSPHSPYLKNGTLADRQETGTGEKSSNMGEVANEKRENCSRNENTQFELIEVKEEQADLVNLTEGIYTKDRNTLETTVEKFFSKEVDECSYKCIEECVEHDVSTVNETSLTDADEEGAAVKFEDPLMKQINIITANEESNMKTGKERENTETIDVDPLTHKENKVMQIDTSMVNYKNSSLDASNDTQNIEAGIGVILLAEDETKVALNNANHNIGVIFPVKDEKEAVNSANNTNERIDGEAEKDKESKSEVAFGEPLKQGKEFD